MPPPTAEQKLKWLKSEPATEYETKCADKIGVGEYEAGFQRTNDILDEGMEIFERSSRSAMAIAGDSIVALLTAEGDLANASCGTYLHAVIVPSILKFVIANFSENPGIKDGDFWFASDATYGGIHNPDLVIAMPVFYHGNLIAWVAAACHTCEVGAITPGGMPVEGKSRFEEGLTMPPIKVGENGVLRLDMIEMFEAYAMRAPALFTIDLKARCTATDRVRRRLLEECDKRGVDYVVGLLRKMIDVGAAGARKVISGWPDGKYRSVNFADAIGLQSALVRSCCLTVTKEDDRLTFDFTGTSPENVSTYNAHCLAAVGHLSNYLFEYVFHELPITSSAFDPIDFIFPSNICLNPDNRAGTSNSVMICSGLMCADHSIFGKMQFPSQDWRQVTASDANAGNAYILAGLSQWGVAYADQLVFSLNTMGQGGRAIGDGNDANQFDWCVFGRAADVEAMENEFPILIPVSQHQIDSCGHGKHRGGSSTFQMWVAHRSPALFFLDISDNSYLQTPQGLYGGHAPACCPGIDVRNSEILKRLKEGDPNVTLDLVPLLTSRTGGGNWEFKVHQTATTMFNEGDIIHFNWSTGGAGYGDCLERDPKAVMADIDKHIISDWVAQNIYKVAYDPVTHGVDYEATEQLRVEEREQRKQRGKSYDEFEKEWLKQKPPEEILHAYGSWPDAKLTAPIIRP